jgi:hypothetical protein
VLEVDDRESLAVYLYRGAVFELVRRYQAKYPSSSILVPVEVRIEPR